jgi:flavoprotein
MKTTRTELREVVILIAKCDFCEYKVETEQPYVSHGQIACCTICNKHMCPRHRTSFSEDGDTVDAFVCPECEPKFRKAWDWALENAGRHDDILEIAVSRL